MTTALFEILWPTDVMRHHIYALAPPIRYPPFFLTVDAQAARLLRLHLSLVPPELVLLSHFLVEVEAI